jgi:hypothetical protein
LAKEYLVMGEGRVFRVYNFLGSFFFWNLEIYKSIKKYFPQREKSVEIIYKNRTRLFASLSAGTKVLKFFQKKGKQHPIFQILSVYASTKLHEY